MSYKRPPSPNSAIDEKTLEYISMESYTQNEKEVNEPVNIKHRRIAKVVKPKEQNQNKVAIPTNGDLLKSSQYYESDTAKETSQKKEISGKTEATLSERNFDSFLNSSLELETVDHVQKIQKNGVGVFSEAKKYLSKLYSIQHTQKQLQKIDEKTEESKKIHDKTSNQQTNSFKAQCKQKIISLNNESPSNKQEKISI